MTRFPEIAVVLIALTVTSGAYAQTASSKDRDQSLLMLGEHFLREEHSYRAVGVFEELAYFSRDEALKLHARIRVADAYRQGEQFP